MRASRDVLAFESEGEKGCVCLSSICVYVCVRARTRARCESEVPSWVWASGSDHVYFLKRARNSCFVFIPFDFRLSTSEIKLTSIRVICMLSFIVYSCA